jgi:hypothetical protein
MARRIASVVACVIISSWALTGCLLNTPDRVVERFIARLKGMRWRAMAELVDWPQSSQFVTGLPASNKGKYEEKSEVMKRIAENFTGFPVRKKTDDQIKHEFVYLKLATLEHMKDGGGWAWLEIKITIDTRAKKVQILVMKIKRIWRIVLTDSIFK